MRLDVVRAVEVLSGGGLVALPTETVYGLAADARQTAAVERIFDLKGRPHFNPLIVHVENQMKADEIGVFTPGAKRLVDVFWPGPLTLVVPLRVSAGISPLVSAGLETIALRAPAHPLAQLILSRSGLALCAPSANISGRVSPTSADHVRAGLNGIDLIVDGGLCEKGLESTIVQMGEGDKEIILLRPGPVTVENLQGATGLRVVATDQDQEAPLTPGALLKHYSPRARVRLDVLGRSVGEGVLGFGAEDLSLLGKDTPFYNLSEAGDLEEAAGRLFAGLHWMDGQGVSVIGVRPIPKHGVGIAINDRLERAAAK